MYMLTWALYCLLTFPDTSSLQGINRRLNTGLPWADVRIGLTVDGIHAGQGSLKLHQNFTTQSELNGIVSHLKIEPTLMLQCRGNLAPRLMP